MWHNSVSIVISVMEHYGLDTIARDYDVSFYKSMNIQVSKHFIIEWSRLFIWLKCIEGQRPGSGNSR